MLLFSLFISVFYITILGKNKFIQGQEDDLIPLTQSSDMSMTIGRESEEKMLLQAHVQILANNPTASSTSIPILVPSTLRPSTSIPTRTPSSIPTRTPSSIPTRIPSSILARIPSSIPTRTPSSIPTRTPSSSPTRTPSSIPTRTPSSIPTRTPSSSPTRTPTSISTRNPSSILARIPTSIPTHIPSSIPTRIPLFIPTRTPSSSPTQIPSSIPTLVPSSLIPSTSNPTRILTSIPTRIPSSIPTRTPSSIPTRTPSFIPTRIPSSIPTRIPSSIPTLVPSTVKPSTSIPTLAPSTSSPTTASYCASYSASNTNNGTINYSICPITACPGDTVVMSTFSPGTCTGDTYLRLYDPSTGNQLAESDDYDGSLCSQITYTFTSSCRTYQLREGCWSSLTCGGQIFYSGPSAVSQPPIAIATQPPTTLPSATVSTAPGTSLCPSFSVTDTNTGTINYATCSFTACPGDTVLMSTFSPGSCTGDTYLRLYDPSTGNQLTENDDYDGSSCSQITYTFTSSCREYTLREGCWSSSTCEGQVIYSGNTLPTQITSKLPSASPSMLTTKSPSLRPSFLSTNNPSKLPSQASVAPATTMPTTSGMSLCPSFSVTDTNFNTINYATCSFTACPGDTVVMSTFSPGSCTGDTFMRLYDPSTGNQLTLNDDYNDSLCSQITYTFTSSCRAYALRQGCWASSTCSGQVVYSGNTLPTLIPSFIPSNLPSFITPTLVPSTTSPTTASYCASYSASNTNNGTINYSICPITACPGDTVVMSTFSPGSCTGDTYLRLYDPSTGNQLAESDDYDGSLCSQITYTFTSSCRTYQLREGCWSNLNCGGQIYYSGPSAVSQPPIAIATQPPTTAPSTTVSTAPGTSLCPSFSVTDTNTGTINYATCSFTACPGDTVVMSTFSPGSCTGDTYLRLYDPSTGNQLTENDDYDGSSCSQITYTFTSSCREYTLREGCWSSSTCEGQVIYSGNTLPTQITSKLPSASPSMLTTKSPSLRPSFLSTNDPSKLPSQASVAPTTTMPTTSGMSLCPSFSVTDTNFNTINYATCLITACPGDTVVMSTFSPGSCTGDTFMRLYDPSTGNQLTFNDDYNDSLCSQITYIFTSSCRAYALRQGCWASLACSGQVVYSGRI